LRSWQHCGLYCCGYLNEVETLFRNGHYNPTKFVFVMQKFKSYNYLEINIRNNFVCVCRYQKVMAPAFGGWYRLRHKQNFLASLILLCEETKIPLFCFCKCRYKRQLLLAVLDIKHLEYLDVLGVQQLLLDIMAFFSYL